MATILNLETATTNCSVSIAMEGKTIALLEDNSPKYSHAEKLHLFIERSLKEANIQSADLNAVAVSKGPGSYTGLRIGVSAAKGLCYALDIPLISINTLSSMAHSVKIDDGYIIPLLDARRMEVYAAVFDHGKNDDGQDLTSSVLKKIMDLGRSRLDWLKSNQNDQEYSQLFRKYACVN